MNHKFNGIQIDIDSCSEHSGQNKVVQNKNQERIKISRRRDIGILGESFISSTLSRRDIGSHAMCPLTS